MKKEKIKSFITLLIFALGIAFMAWEGVNMYRTTGCLAFFQEARPLFEQMPFGVSFTDTDLKYACSWNKGWVIMFLVGGLIGLGFVILGRRPKPPSTKEIADDNYELSGKFQQFCLLACDNCGYKRLIICFGRVGQKFGRMMFDTFTPIKYCKKCLLIYQKNPDGYIHLIKEKWWEEHCKSLDEFLEKTENRTENADIQEIHEDFDRKKKCLCGGGLVEYEYQECIHCHRRAPKSVYLTLI